MHANPAIAPKVLFLGVSLLNEQASPNSVIERIREAEWVRFACHGCLNHENHERPFESSFAFAGGSLTLLDIAKANPVNAFLSACHTAETPFASSVDEALHLAAILRLPGVIITM